MKKSCKIVMLPTENESKLYIGTNYTNDGTLKEDMSTELRYSQIPIGDNNQHLYLISDDPIKEGDWAYDLIALRVAKVVKVLEDSIRLEGEGDKIQITFNFEKVIASTDSELKIRIEYSLKYMDQFPVVTDKPLPALPVEFIKAYVEAGGIDDVWVEYTEGGYDNAMHMDSGTPANESKPEVREDGTIGVSIWQEGPIQERSGYEDSLPVDALVTLKNADSKLPPIREVALTPKGEADALYKKFSEHAMYWDCGNDSPISEDHAKQCALICVDKIMDSWPLDFGVNYTTMKKYWQEVKQEIEKL